MNKILGSGGVCPQTVSTECAARTRPLSPELDNPSPQTAARVTCHTDGVASCDQGVVGVDSVDKD